jgi:hypothetical protein
VDVSVECHSCDDADDPHRGQCKEDSPEHMYTFL